MDYNEVNFKNTGVPEESGLYLVSVLHKTVHGEEVFFPYVAEYDAESKSWYKRLFGAGRGDEINDKIVGWIKTPMLHR